MAGVAVFVAIDMRHRFCIFNSTPMRTSGAICETDWAVNKVTACPAPAQTSNCFPLICFLSWNARFQRIAAPCLHLLRQGCWLRQVNCSGAGQAAVLVAASLLPANFKLLHRCNVTFSMASSTLPLYLGVDVACVVAATAARTWPSLPPTPLCHAPPGRPVT